MDLRVAQKLLIVVDEDHRHEAERLLARVDDTVTFARGAEGGHTGGNGDFLAVIAVQPRTGEEVIRLVLAVMYVVRYCLTRLDLHDGEQAGFRVEALKLVEEVVREHQRAVGVKFLLFGKLGICFDHDYHLVLYFFSYCICFFAKTQEPIAYLSQTSA